MDCLLDKTRKLFTIFWHFINILTFPLIEKIIKELNGNENNH